ncbi:hypothetical protein HL658_09875 [Azospirillum sp. RWY-5-1]|uniref:Uncharacterized protein n=1 Tax=Azospirillum oleiclasticum TaxID=2735135 RepID=A0ABX2T888_9PROT|nr:hypothetical protein [Azospirillum oleiclasticum]NYZ12860.1 hypothetical protein [Azospirillum oleiclasticum]NYZ20020.1 hypothetical protein [Azospirillum oleiclasticum]
MVDIEKRSLWDAHRGWRVGPRGHVAVWPATVPGTDTVLPQINVCTLRDDELCEEFTSGVWALTPDGRPVAERIARDLLAFGYAWLWPHEAGHVRIAPAPEHMIHLIGEPAHG